MLHLPYPIVNVLTKIDNLKSVGGADLPFNLDFYTEVQDLNYLLPALNEEQNATSRNAEKFQRLNEALIGLVDDFGLVGFETLAVEDRASMAGLLRSIDRASGYVFAGARGTDESGKTLSDESSIWAQAMSDQWAGKIDVRDVQERWVDRKEELDEIERQGWEAEAKAATATPSSAEVRERTQQAHGVVPDEKGKEEDDDDETMEQRKWMEELQRTGKVDGGTRVTRK